MIAMVAEARQRLEERRAVLGRCPPEHAASDTSSVADLAETLAAIERIELGTYGRCESCAGAIGRQRLLALPAARYCNACGSAAR